MESVINLRIRFGKKICPVTLTALGNNKYSMQFPYFQPMIDEVKNMEERQWDAGNKQWIITMTQRNLFALDLLTSGPKSKNYFLPIVKHSEKADIHTLWSHQVDMYNFLLTRHRCILAAEMRTGKTLPTLLAAANSNVNACWVISTVSAIRGLKLEVIKWGLPAQLFTFFTYDAFKEMWKTHDFLHGQLPQFVVFDECHKLKNPDTQNWNATKDFVDNMENMFKGEEYVIGLSGTPAPKDPTDWWGICEIIRSGLLLEGTKQKLGRNLGQWKQQEGLMGQIFWQLDKTPDNPSGWIREKVFDLYRRLKPLVQVHLKENCLDLPAKRYVVIDIPPSKELLRVAKTIAETAENVLATINTLRQLSDGFSYIKEYDEATNKVKRTGVEFVGSPKLDRLRLDLDEHEDIGRLIVYSGFQGSVDLITRVCLEKGWVVLQADGRGWDVKLPTQFESDSEAKNAWTTDFCLNQLDRSTNDGTIEKLVFVAQSDSAGTGLELSASPTIIYYSNTNNGSARMQSEDRAHSANMDKNRGLTIIDYCHLPSDYAIRDSLLQKKDVQRLSMGAIKECFVNI
jgi:hypothetical protein